MTAVSNSIGCSYAESRRADPRIVSEILTLLNFPRGARLADIGAGTGNYSRALADAGFCVQAIEPSAVMRSQAAKHPGFDWLEGTAEALSLLGDSVDGIVSTLASHHFTSLPDAAREMHRICPNGLIVIFTIDLRECDRPWFYDYFPAFHQQDLDAFLPVDQLAGVFAANKAWETAVTPFPLPHDLIDQFMIAGWNRPEIYFDEIFRANISAFALADPAEVKDGLSRLQLDLETGAWDEQHGHLRQQETFDAGYLFVSCRSPRKP